MMKQYVNLLRPHQWLKNLLLFFPPFFGGKILEQSILTTMIPSFLSFSLAASCGYILNDIKDREYDSRHRSKKHRAIASGDISPLSALIIAGALFVSAIILAGIVSAGFTGLIIIYLLISFFYTLYFKHIVIIDIFFVAFGFLVRILAGGEAFNIQITSWLFLTVFLVALFLASGKRLGELITLGENVQGHRTILNHYSTSFLEGILWFSASAALVTYSLYSIENTRKMFYTIPLAAFGLIRYVYMVKEGNGDPTEALLKDKQIMATGICWILMIGIIIYR